MASDATVIESLVGETVRFAKTVSECDIYLFAGITGDFAPNHVNAEYMRGSVYGRRIAHGALLVGYMSTASWLMAERCRARGITATPVSLGYDRIRFLAPVYPGDTVEASYVVAEVDAARQRARGRIEMKNQRGELVAVAEHLVKWVALPPAIPPPTDASGGILV